MRKRTWTLLCLISAACLAQPAAAQFTYKSTMSDGRVIYGDAPVPGATKVEKSKPNTADKGVRPPVAREAEVLKQMEAARAARAGPGDRQQQLQEALRRAEAEKAAGAEPLPGERLGTAGGGSRLSEAYFARQKQLDANVEQARRNLEAASGSGPAVDPGSLGGAGAFGGAGSTGAPGNPGGSSNPGASSSAPPGNSGVQTGWGAAPTKK